MSSLFERAFIETATKIQSRLKSGTLAEITPGEILDLAYSNVFNNIILMEAPMVEQCRQAALGYIKTQVSAEDWKTIENRFFATYDSPKYNTPALGN